MVQSPISRVTVRPDPTFGQSDQYHRDLRPADLWIVQYHRDPRPADLWIVGDR